MTIKDIIEKLEEMECEIHPTEMYEIGRRDVIEDLLKWIKSNLEKGDDNDDILVYGPQRGDFWKRVPIEELQILYENTFTQKEWVLSSDYRTDKLIDRILLGLMVLERKLNK